MADLQCPATAVLLDEAADPPPWLKDLRIAGRFRARDSRSVVSLVDETADLYRGETFVVAAPSPAVEEALRYRGIDASAPLVIEIDSDGWRRPAPGAGRR
ncbi:hypothetical protein [Arthrobacter sp. B1805]|uniref:hypothetical protein n=1 Tax=Arthrobacter sp. B1805 TaxID=2058892 RepID=UPI000CE2E68D|nr:hypothetical protein [Arthrobacter sp. B1805]